MDRIDRTGERRLMNCGLWAEIIKYRNCQDIDVRFENGIIKTNKQYISFKKGNITYINKESEQINRIGEERMMNCGMKAKIIEYKNYKNIDIRFEDGHIRKHVRYGDFIKGNVKNLYLPEVFGVGYVGDAKTVDENNKNLMSYNCWHNMLMRCYSETYQRNKPTYKKCEVCDEWLCYSNFKKWYDDNIYEINEELNLDKDILISNNYIYSPKTCIFVPKYINSLFKGCNKKSSLPSGIGFKNNKYEARIKIKGKLKYLGVYKTIEEANEVYRNAKLELIKNTAEEYKDKIPIKLYDRLIEISNEEG